MQFQEEMSRGGQGIVYYAVGPRYIQEAIVSALSVRERMPELEITLFTDVEGISLIPDNIFDLIYKINPSVGVKAQKMDVLLRSPFEKTLYLDTDTYLAAPVNELFELLDTFDFAISLAQLGRLRQGWGSAPPCFPVLNSAVIAFRNSAEVTSLFKDWMARHQEVGGQDQPPLREALFASNIRWVPLTNSYNFSVDFPQNVRHFVKILHGHRPDLAKLAERVQPMGGMSVVVPAAYLYKVRLLGRKTVRPTIADVLKASFKLLGRKFGLLNVEPELPGDTPHRL